MTTTGTPAPAASSTPATPATAPGGGAGGSSLGLTDSSSVDDVLAALGAPGDDFSTFDDAEGEAPAGGAGGEAAAAKPNGDGASAGASPDAPAGADDDVAATKAILARSAARRRARAAARPAPAPAAAAPASNGTAKPEQTPAAPAASAADGIDGAVKDVLAQLARLAGDDGAAASAAAAGGTPDTTQAARNAELAGIREKVEAIAKGLEGNEETKGVVKKLETQLEHFENQRKVHTIISTRLDAIEAEVPTLAGHRDAVGIVERAAGKFYDKYGKAPNLTELAKRIEKRMAAGKPTRSDTREAPLTRKTISSSHGAPPSARTGPDKRTKDEIERDLYTRFGVEPDADDPFA